MVSGRNDKEKLAAMYHELFDIGQFSRKDKDWMTDKFVNRLASGETTPMYWFWTQFSKTFALDPLNELMDAAITVASRAKNHSITLALHKESGRKPNPELVEIVSILGETGTLK